MRRNTACDAYRTGQAYNIEQMTFAEYLDNLGTKKGRESYLAVQNVKRTFPMLEPDVSFAPYVEKIHAGPFLWVARAGHFEYCHFDPDDGFLFVVTGRKTVCKRMKRAHRSLSINNHPFPEGAAVCTSATGEHVPEPTGKQGADRAGAGGLRRGGPRGLSAVWAGAHVGG